MGQLYISKLKSEVMDCGHRHILAQMSNIWIAAFFHYSELLTVVNLLTAIITEKYFFI